MSRNPAVILYDAYGTAVITYDGYAISSSSPGLPIVAKNISGNAKHISSDNDGYVGIRLADGGVFYKGATETLQTSGNSYLNSINDKTLTAGQKTMANSSPIVIASDQSNIPALVEGKYAAASTSSPYPLVIGGKYSTDGSLKYIAIDSLGRLITSSSGSTSNSQTIELNYNKSYNIAAAFADVWFKAINYTIPTNYNFNMGQFLSLAGDTRATVRISKFIVLGSFNIGTQVFTAGSSYTLPVFASYLEAEITTATENKNTVTLTATYTNQSGTAGRTATAVLAKQTWPVGSKIPFTLQGDDFGIISVSNITRSAAAETGIVNINGGISFWQQRLISMDTTYSAALSKDSSIVKSNETLSLDFSTNAGSNVNRMIKVIGTLEG